MKQKPPHIALPLLMALLLSLCSGMLFAQAEYITTWDTTNPGISDTNSIRIPIAGTYDVDIGDDGSYELVNQTGPIVIDVTTHGYAAGVIQITLRNAGTGINNIGFANMEDRLKILSIDQWGSSINWTTMTNAYFGCSNLQVNATDAPNLSGVTEVTNMFRGTSLTTANGFNTWNVSGVQNFLGMFWGSGFNANIGGWNTGAATNMGFMFRETPDFNQDISTWNVSNVTTFQGMFQQAASFNQPLSTWNTGSAIDMGNMFILSPFNQDISGWNVSNVISMTRMFESTPFNQDISGWNVGMVQNFSSMFRSNTAFSQPIGVWNTSSATNMSHMFHNADAFNQDIGSWNVSNVTTFENMFVANDAFNQASINNWNVSSAINMGGMFAFSVFNQPLNNWNTLVGNVQFFNAMFLGNAVFSQDISGWDTSSAIDMSNMFNNADAFNIDIGVWDVSNVTNFSNMFAYNGIFNQPNINNWNTISGQNMSGMFRAAVFNQPLNNWNVSNVTNFSNMFQDNLVFNQNIDNWNTGSATTMNSMFLNADAFNQPLDNWDVSNVMDFVWMFARTATFNQDLNSWTLNPAGPGIAFMFRETVAFNGNIANWNVSGVTNFLGLFFNAVAFNQDIGGWNTSAATNMSIMLSAAIAFNQDISGWDVSNVTNISGILGSATAFNQNLGSWNIGAATNANGMLSNSGLSLTNWDATLLGWFAQGFSNGIPLGADGLTFCAATIQRDAMENAGIFTFTGDLKACAPGGVAAINFLWYQANFSAFETSTGVDPAENGDNVLRWVDNGNNELDATPVLGAPTFVEDFLNFNPGLNFNNSPVDPTGVTLNSGIDTDHHVVAVYLGNTQNASFYATGDDNTTTNEAVFYGLNTGNRVKQDFTGNTFDAPITSNTPMLVNYNYDYTLVPNIPPDPITGDPEIVVPDEAARKISINGSDLATENLTEPNILNLNPTTDRIGGSFIGGEAFNGTLAEIVVYATVQEDTDLRQIQTYLGLKYGITLNPDNDGDGNIMGTEGDYLASDGTTVWDYSANTAFHNDVIGLFIDETTSLDQRIAKSVNTDAIITITSADAVADYTSMNTIARTPISGTLAGIVLGNNNGDVTQFVNNTSSTMVHNDVGNAWSRAWKTQATNYTGTSNIQFNNSNINAGESYWLLADADHDGDYSNATVTGPVTAVGNTVSFEGVDINNTTITIAKAFKLGPGGVSDALALWLKADEGVTGTAPISQWNDQSGNALHATPELASSEPNLVTDTFSFNPAIAFSSDALTTPHFDLGAGKSFFFVDVHTGGGSDPAGIVLQKNSDIGSSNRSNTSSTSALGLSSGFGTYALDPAPALDINIPHIRGGAATVGSPGTSYDTGVTGSITAGTSSETATFLRIAAGIDAFIPEVIVYDRDLQAAGTEPQRIQSYLGLKYGITLGSGAFTYLASDESTIIWNPATAGTFTHDIFGIGRDDMSGLGQLKAKSFNPEAVWTILAEGESTSDTNASVDYNFTDLADLEFLTISNNNGGNVWTAAGAPIEYNVLQRQWSVQEQGNSASDSEVGTLQLDIDVADVDFDIPDLIAGSAYYIIFDTNDDGDYSDETPVALTDMGGNIWRITNQNLDHGTEFTIATLGTHDLMRHGTAVVRGEELPMKF